MLHSNYSYLEKIHEDYRGDTLLSDYFVKLPNLSFIFYVCLSANELTIFVDEFHLKYDITDNPIFLLDCTSKADIDSFTEPQLLNDVVYLSSFIPTSEFHEDFDDFNSLNPSLKVGLPNSITIYKMLNFISQISAFLLFLEQNLSIHHINKHIFTSTNFNFDLLIFDDNLFYPTIDIAKITYNSGIIDYTPLKYANFKSLLYLSQYEYLAPVCNLLNPNDKTFSFYSIGGFYGVKRSPKLELIYQLLLFSLIDELNGFVS